MAYMSQTRKAEMSPAIKAICKKYGVKASIGVQHHSTLVLNIQASEIDFIGSINRVMSQHPRFNEREYRAIKDSCNVNVYRYSEQFDGVALEFLSEVIPAMYVGNHDNSDSQSDYFDVGWYVDVNVGRWNKPYLLTSSQKTV